MHPRDSKLAALLFLTAMLCFPALAAAAVASIDAVHVLPSSPTTCDAVTLRAEGSMAGCDTVASAEVSGPEVIPEWVGPMPAYRTRIHITVERDDSHGCPAIVRFYSREFSMGQLPIGQHFVTATERLVDTEGNLLDSSTVNATFTVSVGDSCTTAPCVFLDFLPSWPGEQQSCDAFAAPGGQGCFTVALNSSVPAGGVQLRIQITDDEGNILPAGSFTPEFVATTLRSTEMQLAWEADGSAINVMLFSSTGATIPPGHDRILRICYQIGPDVPDGAYAIRFEQSLVADAEGHALPLCPTFREPLGQLCIVATPGCDIDGDGSTDIRDIMRLVRCALAGTACPDTIAGRSDCNDDGGVDVRDVICCVRKLLAQPPNTPSPAPTDGPSSVRIGFTRDATWTSSLAGHAAIDIQPGDDFGAVEFEVAPSTGIRITGLALEGTGYSLEWAHGVGGRAHAVLLRQSTAAEAASPRIAIRFERIGTAPGTGELRLETVRSATWDAAAASYTVTAGAARIPAQPIATPAVYTARPNPFGATTEIPFVMPSAGRVSIRVFDVSGRLVRTLVDGERAAGVGRATWDGRDASGRPLPAGIYFAKLTALGVESTARIMKLR